MFELLVNVEQILSLKGECRAWLTPYRGSMFITFKFCIKVTAILTEICFDAISGNVVFISCAEHDIQR